MKNKINTIIKTLTLLFLINCLLFPFTSNAQPIRNEEIHNYIQANIIPVLKPYRYEFEDKLTKDEKTKIDNIRNEIAKTRENLQKEKLTRKSRAFRSSRLSKSQVNIIKQAKETLYQALLETMIIAENHKNDIQTILQNEDVEKEKWINDLTKIKEENSSMRILILNPILKHNLLQVEPLEHASELLFILWNPDKAIQNTI